VSGGRIFGTIALVYVEVFRGTSLVVQLFRLYYALPLVGISFDPVTTGIVGLALNTGACDLTMLLVTHEMRFAREVSDRVCFFDRGRIVEQGEPERIFTSPEQPRTLEFLQSVPPWDAGRETRAPAPERTETLSPSRVEIGNHLGPASLGSTGSTEARHERPLSSSSSGPEPPRRSPSPA
jgi:hypothetical protein